MTAIVSHLVRINQTTGVIASVQSYSPDQPADSEVVDGYLIKHLRYTEHSAISFNEEDPATFAINYIWKDNAWFNRGAPTNSYYNWVDGAWTLDTTELNEDIRIERNRKLSGCDWTQVPDSPLSDTVKTEWRAYRQTLRDIMANLPANIDHPDDTTWPTEP